MVHFPPLPSPAYVFSGRYSGMSQSGFPHSEIPGSKPACGSPRLIAACHVLHRLLAPRHSPYALSSLTKCSLHLTYLLSDPKAGLPRICGQKTTHCRIFSCQKTACLTVMPTSRHRFRPHQRCYRENLVVENTGIEPVTSWLQTRRSPS
jgi:hypothetical protein